LVYAHVPNAPEKVRLNAFERLPNDHADNYAAVESADPRAIKRGTTITAVPHLPNCRVSPERTDVVWLRDWHVAEFEFQLKQKTQAATIEGSVSFYVDPVLIGEVRFTMPVSTGESHASQVVPDGHVTAPAYQAIFVSYSHRDSWIVNRLEKAYQVLGNKYLRDVRDLRSGDEWNPALLGLIDKA